MARRILAAATALGFALTLAAPALAAPPWWAPAHGRRAQHRAAPATAWGAQPATAASPWSREFLGTLLGGAAGGLLGSQVGGGHGRTAAIIGGTVLGVLVGGDVGRSMDRTDRMWVGRTLETVPTRTTSTWQNPDTQVVYQVTPTRTYERTDGRYCREYQTEATVGGKTQQVYGTACRQPDGSWEVVN